MDQKYTNLNSQIIKKIYLSKFVAYYHPVTFRNLSESYKYKILIVFTKVKS